MKTRNKILSLLGILLGITFVICIAASCNSEERKLSSEVKKITESKHSYASLTNDSLFIYASQGDTRAINKLIDVAEKWLTDNNSICEIDMEDYYGPDTPEKHILYLWNYSTDNDELEDLGNSMYNMSLTYLPDWHDDIYCSEIESVRKLFLFCDTDQLLKADGMRFLTCLPNIEYIYVKPDDLSKNNKEESEIILNNIKAYAPDNCVVEIIAE